MSDFYEYDKALSKINDLEHENFLLKARIAELEAERLKACPFCGSENIFYDAKLCYIECKKCGFTFDTLFLDWSTRPIENALRNRIAELEAQLAEALPYLINEKIRKGQFEEVN